MYKLIFYLNCYVFSRDRCLFIDVVSDTSENRGHLINPLTDPEQCLFKIRHGQSDPLHSDSEEELP